MDTWRHRDRSEGRTTCGCNRRWYRPRCRPLPAPPYITAPRPGRPWPPNQPGRLATSARTPGAITPGPCGPYLEAPEVQGRSARVQTFA